MSHREPATTDELFAQIYDELHQIAERQMLKEKPGQTLDATALVHEVYVRICRNPPENWGGRTHFFLVAATAMRRILVDKARRKRRQKHGGDAVRVRIDPNRIAVPEPTDELIALDEALVLLEETDPQAAEIVHLRYFGGMSIPEAAEALGISPRTADRLWAFARAWLHEKIYQDPVA